MTVKNARNILIVLVIAALVVVIPGGGTGAAVATQAVSRTFLASIAWVASLMYREHRMALHALGDGRRAVLYGAAGAAALTLTATPRLWHTAAGEIVWFAVIGAAIYAVFAVVWSARKY